MSEYDKETCGDCLCEEQCLELREDEREEYEHERNLRSFGAGINSVALYLHLIDQKKDVEVVYAKDNVQG
jgi:hypothetical protein